GELARTGAHVFRRSLPGSVGGGARGGSSGGARAGRKLRGGAERELGGVVCGKREAGSGKRGTPVWVRWWLDTGMLVTKCRCVSEYMYSIFSETICETLINQLI